MISYRKNGKLNLQALNQQEAQTIIAYLTHVKAGLANQRESVRAMARINDEHAIHAEQLAYVKHAASFIEDCLAALHASREERKRGRPKKHRTGEESQRDKPDDPRGRREGDELRAG